jgi:hypothetical protein
MERKSEIGKENGVWEKEEEEGGGGGGKKTERSYCEGSQLKTWQMGVVRGQIRFGFGFPKESGVLPRDEEAN